MTQSKQRYLFGQGDLPARRLRKLAEVFAPTTTAFLRRVAIRNPDVVIDLGCGPGYTTRLLAELLDARATYGLDNGKAFLQIANAHPTPGILFVDHDIRETPFPAPAADVIYGRFILAHLKDVPALVASWGTQLKPGGALLLEETEFMETTHPACSRYIEIVEAMLAHNGSELYAGRLIRELDPAGLVPGSSELTRYRVANRDAAAMFSMNIPTWKLEPYIEERYDADEIGTLEASLVAIAANVSATSEIEWGLRQCVFRKP